MSTPNYSPSSVDFTCQCGTQFVVGGRPGRYVCRRCGSAHYFGISEQEWIRKLNEREQRRRKVIAKAARSSRITKAVFKLQRHNEGFGDAVARLEDLAIKYDRLALARDLGLLLATCGCDRQAAVQYLNDHPPA